MWNGNTRLHPSSYLRTSIWFSKLLSSFLLQNNIFIKQEVLVDGNTLNPKLLSKPSNVRWNGNYLVFNYFIFCGWITILSSWEYLKPNKDNFLQQLYFVLKIIKSYIFEIEKWLFSMTYHYLSLGVVHKRGNGRAVWRILGALGKT